MKFGIATCPFCNVINRFGKNERRCPHLIKLGKKNKYLIKKERDGDYAVFREETEDVKVLIEEKVKDEKNDGKICNNCEYLKKYKAPTGLRVYECTLSASSTYKRIYEIWHDEEKIKTPFWCPLEEEKTMREMRHGDMVDPKNCGGLVYRDIEQIAIGADGTIYILDEWGNYEYAKGIGEDYEILWWTGLKDKNGKDIYEGDIVSWIPIYVQGEKLLGKVVYGKGWYFIDELNHPIWEYYNGHDKTEATFYNLYEGVEQNFEWDELEIVGNIYESPELF